MNSFLSSLYIFIYLFHMPLFVFISGYFYKNYNKQKLKNSLRQLIETLIISQLVWEIILILLNNQFELKSLYTPRWILWYLLSLCFWKIFSCFSIPKFKKTHLIIISLLICYIIGFIPSIGFPLSLSRTFVFYPFFLIGCYTTESQIALIRSKSKILSGLILISIFSLCIYFHSDIDIIKNILWGSRAYSLIGIDIFLISISRMLFILLGAIMIICVINITPTIQFFAKFGKDTLIFYIYQGYIVFAFYILNEKLKLYSTPYLLVSSIAITVILAIFSKYKISHILLNPISYTLAKINLSKKSS